MPSLMVCDLVCGCDCDWACRLFVAERGAGQVVAHTAKVCKMCKMKAFSAERIRKSVE